MGHILGMTSLDLPFFYDTLTGLPHTPRPITHNNNDGRTCIQGQPPPPDVYFPHNNTLSGGITNQGIRYFQVTTPTVTQIARNHFNCPTMNGMRLENQPTSSTDCFGSHWEERLAWNTLMSPQHNTYTIQESKSTRHKRLPHLYRDLEYIFETPGTRMRLLLQKDSNFIWKLCNEARSMCPTTPLLEITIWSDPTMPWPCRVLRESQ